MKPAAFILVLSLAAIALAPQPAAAIECVYGNSRDCLVSVEWVVCVTEPCDGLTICVGRGKVCTDRLLP